MVMRGVQKVQSKTVTSTMLGVFREDPRTREVRFGGIVDHLKVAAVFDGEYKLEMLEKGVEKS
jgi:hypothetical protein